MSQPINSDKELERKRDELIFDLIKRRADNEFERTKNLDSKANNAIGIGGIIVSLLIGSGSILSGGATFKLSALISNMSLATLYFSGIASLLLSIGFALSALRVIKWIVVPNVQTIIDEYTSLEYGEVLKRNAGQMAKAVTDTEVRNDTKAKLINFSWYFLISGLVLVLLSVILMSFSSR